MTLPLPSLSQQQQAGALGLLVGAAVGVTATAVVLQLWRRAAPSSVACGEDRSTTSSAGKRESHEWL